MPRIYFPLSKVCISLISMAQRTNWEWICLYMFVPFEKDKRFRDNRENLNKIIVRCCRPHGWKGGWKAMEQWLSEAKFTFKGSDHSAQESSVGSGKRVWILLHLEVSKYLLPCVFYLEKYSYFYSVLHSTVWFFIVCILHDFIAWSFEHCIILGHRKSSCDLECCKVF